MRDISARELKGHNILAVERFLGQHPLDDRVFRPASLFLRQPRRRNAAVSYRGRLSGRILSQKRREIKIRRYARIIEGHVLDLQAGQAPPPLINKPLLRKEGIEYVYDKGNPGSDPGGLQFPA